MAGFDIVMSSDMADNFIMHIKNMGHFPKLPLSSANPIYPDVIDDIPTFNKTQQTDTKLWEQLSIKQVIIG